MTFIGSVDYLHERVCVEPCGFRVASRAGRVPGMPGASVLPEVVAQLLARSGDAPGFKNGWACVSAMLRDNTQGATVHEHIFET